jgi:hypothetical protein
MSYAPDNIIELLQDGMSRVSSVTRADDGWRVVTHCMYPSNGLVEVRVRGGARTVVVSDEGGAVGEALSAGIAVKDYDRTLGHLVKEQGLLLKRGIIYSPPVSIEGAAMAVVLVANASQEVSRWLFDHTKIKRTRDFRTLLAEFLRKNFDDRVAPMVIVGKSNKPHKFPNVISLTSGKRLIVDPVTNEASSVNARVVANLDVKAVDDPSLIQRIIYDDEESWAAADLNLLQVGATVVPFSRSQEVIQRIAAGG